MLEMLRARKEALQERGVKGFTLMEMLIVIAIIAILIAIAIPVLSAQLENAGEATDAANIRSAYAEVAAAALQNPSKTSTSTVTITQGDKSAWTNDSVKDTTIGGVTVGDIDISSGSVDVTYTPADDSTAAKLTIGSKEATLSTVTTS